MTTQVNNWYVPSQPLILPATFQRSATMNDILFAIASGPALLDRITTVSANATTTISANGSRRVVITGGTTHTVKLPASPTVGDPPVWIIHSSQASDTIVTIDGNGHPILSGSTPSQFGLATNGDYVCFVYQGATIGWVPIAINSNITMEITANTTFASWRFQKMNFYSDTGHRVIITTPADAQPGESLAANLSWSAPAGSSFRVDSFDTTLYVSCKIEGFKDASGTWRVNSFVGYY